jgi:DNA polymerase III subunit gamma/tau
MVFGQEMGTGTVAIWRGSGNDCPSASHENGQESDLSALPRASALSRWRSIRHALAMAQMGTNAGSSDKGTSPEVPYQVVARRFRPQSFEELVGQDDVLQSLRVALTQDRVPHAFVFSGSRGVGKTTSARILARCLNCEQGPTADPCGECDSCHSILEGKNPDVMEVDAASNNGVDDVRQLRESVAYATMQSRYRVVILDEAHMMTKPAFNAFLKTLEEPPPKVVFVLATTELHKLPDTIRSRCQVLRFRRVGEEDLQKRLSMIAAKEGVDVPKEVLAEIAMSVRGGVRDAETALERLLPLAREMGDSFDLNAYRTLTAGIDGAAVVEVVAALLNGDAKRGLHFAHELAQGGTDEREALGEIVDVLRYLLLLRVDGPDSVLVPLAGTVREELQALAKDTETVRLDAMIGAGVLGRDRLKRVDDRAAVFEVALVRMAQAGALPTLADLLAEARSGRLASSAPQPTPPPQATSTRGPRETPPARLSGRAAPPARKPAPAKPPAKPPATPATSPNELRSRVMVALESRKLLQTTFELCRLVGPDDKGRVVLTLDTESKMHRDRLRSAVIEQELKDTVRTAAGREVSVEIRIAEADGSSADTAGKSKAPPKPQAAPGERAKRVLKHTGGRVVEVNPRDRIVKKPRTTQHEPEPEMLDPGEPPTS